MGWRDLLEDTAVTVTSPWVGGRALRLGARTWTIDGRLPREHGWSEFATKGRKATFTRASEAEFDSFRDVTEGYLVGDRLVPDGIRVHPDPRRIVRDAERVHLIEPGLDRFSRVSAGRMSEGGPLIYRGMEMPLGPEDEVLEAYLDEADNVDALKAVPPALDAAFRMESWQRAEAKRIREELAAKRRAEALRREREARRQALAEKLGDGAGRRDMARVDFEEAARAALAVAGAVYLDHRPSVNANEVVVRFRLNKRRFECTCDENLRIIDSGICLINHETDERGDTYFTLESLPGVIQQAEREHRLVVFRHA